MLRIVFFGTPDFAVRSLDALLGSPHAVVGVVTQPDRPRGRGQRVSASPVKARAEAAGVRVWQPDRLKDDGFLDDIRGLDADLGVVAAYGRILPQAVLDIPRLGLINVHASLLPRHRGAAPIERAILDGDPETGVTIMRVVKALDAGAMLASRSTPIDPVETGGALEARLALLGADLLVETLDPLEGGLIVEVPQDDASVTYAARIDKTDGLIAWDATAQAVHDRIRALSPWPHAYTFHEAARYVLHDSRPHESLDAAWRAAGQTRPPEALSPHRPGTVLPAPRGRLFVAAGDASVLEILQLQEEGRRVLPARDFLAGRPLPPGTRFASADPT